MGNPGFYIYQWTNLKLQRRVHWDTLQALLIMQTFSSSFIRLADYLIVNTMHALAVNSVATLLNYLEEQLQSLKYSSSPTADDSVSTYHTQPKKPQTCCKLWIFPGLLQVAASLLTSSSCSKSVKIRFLQLDICRLATSC